MSRLLRISPEKLPVLLKLYKQNWPLSVAHYASIEHFIIRFREKPEWKEKVKFWTLNDDWEQNGTFAMVNENDGHILFNTLEPWPFNSLQRILELLNYDRDQVFICVRDIFRPIVQNVVRTRNLEVTFDSSTRLYYFTDETLAEVGPSLPDGFYFDSLSINNIPKINSIWAQRSQTSAKLLETMIEHNPSTGLFEKGTNELVAWCLMLETGSMGNLQIDEKYLGNAYGGQTFLEQLRKVREYKRQICFHVVHTNRISLKFLEHLGDWVDNFSWFGVVRKKENPKVTPLWGKL